MAFAAYQSGNTVATLSDRLLFFWGEFVRFAFLLPNEEAGISPVVATGIVAARGFWIVRIALLLIALALLMQAFRALHNSRALADALAPGKPYPGRWYAVWLITGAISVFAIGAFIYMTRALPPDHVNRTLRITEFLAGMPMVFAIFAIAVEKGWIRLHRRSGTVPNGITAGNTGLVVMLATVPVALISLISLVRPFLNQRGMLFIGPYVLLLLAIGIAALPRRATILTALFVILAAAHGVSLAAYAPMTVDPVDYTRFANDLRSAVKHEDLVFVKKAWYATPILYYLPREQYRVTGRNFSQECSRHPDARVWVVLLYDNEIQPEIKRALAGYEVVATITGSQAEAILYENRTRASNAAE